MNLLQKSQESSKDLQHSCTTSEDFARLSSELRRRAHGTSRSLASSSKRCDGKTAERERASAADSIPRAESWLINYRASAVLRSEVENCSHV